MAKRVGGWGSAPDPAGGAYDAPPDPLVGWGGDTPHTPPRSAPSALNFGVPIVVNLRNDHWYLTEQFQLLLVAFLRSLCSLPFRFCEDRQKRHFDVMVTCFPGCQSLAHAAKTLFWNVRSARREKPPYHSLGVASTDIERYRFVSTRWRQLRPLTLPTDGRRVEEGRCIAAGLAVISVTYI